MMLQFAQFATIRAAMAVFTLLLVSLIVFSLMELVPGTCAERYLAFKNTQGSGISVEDIAAEERRLGLDRPFMVRWGSWVGNVMFKGEFGDSCILRLNINSLLGDKFLISLGICLTALLLAYLIAIPVGIIAASSESAVLNNSLRFISYLGLAMPNFLLALIIMLISTVVWGDSLTGLFSNEFRDADWSWARVKDFLSSKLYVTAARARGLYGRRLLWRYPARHALGPIVNSLGFDLNRIFNELPIVALILTLTEAGALLLSALAQSNDQQLAGAIIFLLTATIVAVNFFTDILLALLDPRIRKSVMGGSGA